MYKALLICLFFSFIYPNDDPFDYYKELQITKNASQGEINKAYKNRAHKLHPDRNKHPNAHEQFIKIGKAYSILGDPKKRWDYDNPARPGCHISEYYLCSPDILVWLIALFIQID